MGVEHNLPLFTHKYNQESSAMKLSAILLLGLIGFAAAIPVPQEMATDEECDELDAQAAIAEPLDEMRFFPEMVEDEEPIGEEDCDEVEEPLEIPEDLHYAAASMAGQNEMDYMIDEECENEEQAESSDFAFGYSEEDSAVFPIPDYNQPSAIEEVECEGDEQVEAEEFRGDYEEAEDLGILENADFARVDQSQVKMLNGETDASEIEECEEEY